MGGQAPQGSDKGAAFMGLIGGAIFIGAILNGVVLWTNTRFEGHEAGKKAAVVSVNRTVV